MIDAERVAKHVIAEIDYSEDRLVCSCGVVMRADPRARAWVGHGMEVGASLRINGSSNDWQHREGTAPFRGRGPRVEVKR